MRGLIATVVIGLAAVVAVMAVELPTAQACSTPAPGWSVVMPADMELEVPTDGAVVLSASRFVDGFVGDPLDAIAIEVVESGGDEVSGTVELLELPMAESVPWLDCPAEDLEQPTLIIWTADDPLASETLHEVEIFVVDDVTDPEWSAADLETIGGFELMTLPGPSAPLAVPSLTDEQLDVATSGLDHECCVCESCCGFCPADDEQLCWFVSERDQPRVVAQLDEQANLPDEQRLVRILDDGETEVDVMWKSGPVGVNYEVDETGAYCVTVSVENLATGEVSQSDEVCVEHDESLEFGSRELGGEVPAECDDESVEPGDQDEDYEPRPPVNPDDYAHPGSGYNPDGGGGGEPSSCQMISGSNPLPVAVLFVALLGWGLRRRVVSAAMH